MAYTAVSRSLWTSKKFRQLNEFEKLLYLFLLTGPRVTSLGAYVLNVGHAAIDMDLGLDGMPQVQSAIDRIEQVGLIEYDRDESLVRVLNFLTFNGPKNPKHGTFLCGLVAELPACPIRDRVMTELLSHEHVRKCSSVSKLKRGNGCDTVSKPYGYSIETVSIYTRAHDTPPHPTPPTPQTKEFLKKIKEKKGGPVDKWEVATAPKPRPAPSLPKTAGEHLEGALKRLRAKSVPKPEPGSKEARTPP